MIKILLVTQEKETGLTYHRQSVPHQHLVKNYEYKVDLCYDISEATVDELKDYQIISFLRLVDYQGKTEKIIQTCKDAGCKVILDIDDYWCLSPTHELKRAYDENDIPNQTIAALKNVDWVTTTTEHFGDKIKQYNKNVTVIPNSICEDVDQFNPKPIYNERMRFGWIGGIFHHKDIEMLKPGFDEVWKTANHSKFQLCLGGYGHNQTYNYLETIYTDTYKYPKNKEYQNYLKSYTVDNKQVADTQPYKRLYGTDVYNYGKLYNDIDVALIPLVETSFNSFKSQIKIIEAGWFKKPVIVSNVMPYTIDCNKSNAMLISPSKRNEGWGTAIKSLILNPNKADDLGEALHELVKVKYNMNTVNEVRNDLYKHLCTG